MKSEVPIRTFPPDAFPTKLDVDTMIALVRESLVAFEAPNRLKYDSITSGNTSISSTSTNNC